MGKLSLMVWSVADQQNGLPLKTGFRGVWTNVLVRLNAAGFDAVNRTLGYCWYST